MATYDFSDSSSGRKSTPEIEQLKAEIRRLFLNYIRLRNVVTDNLQDLTYAENHNKPLSEREVLRAEFEQRRREALTIKREILALTAPITPCVVCGDPATAAYEHNAVCADHYAMLDIGMVTISILLDMNNPVGGAE